MKRFLELEAIKEVLVEMTANDELPMDMTQLDIHAVEQKALDKLKDDEQYKRVLVVEKFKNYTSYDNDGDVIKALEELEEQDEEGNGSDMADMHITIWEPFENFFTVSELLDEIN